ncbi:hypothetical protein [Paraflavitalea speifideaquila]|uniref:hypothetical protein n=1 Tax=Paraflavitalea speifideaquila TaxID=3076558 RepID=UPI0028E37AD1|nr:hypothetical protein [Paraflavitalea speifideiaquila]
MKPFFLLLFFTITAYYAIAQEDAFVINEATKINRQLVPAPVIDSLHRLFPKATPIEFYTVPPATAKNAWADADTMVSYSDPASFYLLVLKRGDQKFYSLFSATGLLIMTKQQEDLTYLPGTVKESLKGIRKDYPGFKVRSSRFYRNESRARQMYYEVIAEKGNNQQRFFMMPVASS